MLENTGIPSIGQLLPVRGSQFGEENGRIPTKFNCWEPFPRKIDPFGMWNWKPLGTVIVNWLSSANWLQVAPDDPNDETELPDGSALAIALISRQVCGVPRFKSLDTSRRWPCDPTYPTCRTTSLASSRWMLKLYCAEYWERMWGWNSPKSKIGRNTDQSTGCPRVGF